MTANIEAARAKCVNDFRVASKLFADFVKTAEKHRNALVASIETGTAQVECFYCFNSTPEMSVIFCRRLPL
jgi:hypothetical protein